MITDPKVGDKHWIIFMQDDGSRNRAHLAIAHATILHVEDNWPPNGNLGPICVCAVIPDTNHIFAPVQRVNTYHMYNTWDDAVDALEKTITKGIQDLRRYKEQITDEVREKLQQLPDGYKEEDLKGTVAEFFADQYTMLGIQEYPEQNWQLPHYKGAPSQLCDSGYHGALPPMPGEV